MTRTDYEVVTEADVTIRTFGSAALARRWVLKNRALYGPLQIDEVTRSETRRRVYRTRKSAEAEVVLAVMGRER